MTKIESVQVRNFRSIINSGEINVDPKISTLVGPNEAGKTNFLEALKGFRTDKQYDEDDISFYIDQGDTDLDQVPIVSMKISDVPLNILRHNLIHAGIDKDVEDEVDTVIIKKYHDGRYEAELSEYTGLIDQIDKDRAKRVEDRIQQVVREYENIADFVRNKSSTDLDIRSPYGLRSIGDQESAQIIQTRVDTFREEVLDIENEVEDKIFSEIDDKVQKTRRLLSRIKNESRPAARILADNVYNSAFKKGADLIQDEVAIDDLQDGSTDTFYSDILSLAGIDPHSFHDINPKKRHDKKHKAADQLEEGFNRYWPREDDVGFELSFGGDTVSLHITDDSESTDLATHRSTGFRHFLSFYIRLIASSGDELEDNLLLLDGPGIHLHPEGQKKLKEALENLAEDNQVVYSTHSPFMIDANHVEQIRIFRQDTEEGTQIITDLDEAAQTETEVDVLAPVRTSIGANFADTLFASSANILVEGYTDKRYIEALSEIFQRQEGPTIDYETNIITVDGSKADYLAKILEAENYEYVILLDSDQSGRNRRKSLIDRGINQEKILILKDSIDRYENETEVTIEDLFSNEFYGKQVAQVHDEIEISDIQEAVNEGSGEIVERIVGRLKELKGRDRINDGSYSKGDVADLISDKIANEEIVQEDLRDETVENFRNLINGLNSKLTE